MALGLWDLTSTKLNYPAQKRMLLLTIEKFYSCDSIWTEDERFAIFSLTDWLYHRKAIERENFVLLFSEIFIYYY